MNSSCYVTADTFMILSFFIIGSILAIIGCILNVCSCLIFSRSKSLYNTPFAIFIIALSISDIIKLVAEYFVHLLFIYIQHPYFVCSITWFLTMISENASYAFLCALGIERNLKLWTTGRRWLITRQRACWLTLFIVLVLIIYDHPFLYWPSKASFCYFTLFNYSTIYTCTNAHYHAHGYSFSLTKLILIENIGLNNFILPFTIILINVILIIGLRRRSYQRRYRLGKNINNHWKEHAVLCFILLSSILFIFLTLPIGIIVGWRIAHGEQIPTDNVILLCDLMEILHHCSHFPILIMTSSRIRRKVCERRSQQRSVSFRTQSFATRSHTPASDQHDICL